MAEKDQSRFKPAGRDMLARNTIPFSAVTGMANIAGIQPFGGLSGAVEAAKMENAIGKYFSEEMFEHRTSILPSFPVGSDFFNKFIQEYQKKFQADLNAALNSIYHF